VLGYDIDPQGGRLVVNPAEAERVNEIFAIGASSTSLVAAQREVNARRLATKDWISKSGKHHGGQRFTQSTLGALLRKILYMVMADSPGLRSDCDKRHLKIGYCSERRGSGLSSVTISPFGLRTATQ
jgi:hypothetical protein